MSRLIDTRTATLHEQKGPERSIQPVKAQVSLGASMQIQPKSVGAVKSSSSSTTIIDLSYYSLATLVDVTEAFEQQIQEEKIPAVISHAVALKLGYNNFISITGLFEVVSKYIRNPELNVLSLDLSMNKLNAIEPELLQFQSLQSLYLHGNNIQKITEVRKLSGLQNLTKITMHGNNWIVPAKTKTTVVIGGKKQQSPSSPSQNQQSAMSSTGQSSAAGASITSTDGTNTTNGTGQSGQADAQQRIAGVYFKTERLESTPHYRDRLVWMLRAVPLKSLDNTLVSQQDRVKALQWANTHPHLAQGPTPKVSEDPQQDG